MDGEVGYIGGSGWADHWLHSKKNHPRWRDTMLKVCGDTVNSLQGTFAENWLEASGEVLAGEEFYPSCKEKKARSKTLVINSAPSVGSSTRARVLYQTLLASAKDSIVMTTPYFLPDKSARDVMVNAIHRGVRVRILVPGKKSDHWLTRSSSRRLYGDLLKAGAELHEYTPAMVHAKVLVIDGRWCVLGSTNFDHRSFGINDEVNLVAFDRVVGDRLLEDFEGNLKESKQITYGAVEASLHI